MAKQIVYGDDAWHEIRDGLGTLSRAVKTTLGPSGRNVILEKSFGKPEATKDGVTVAKDIELPDPFQNMAAKLVADVAGKTNDEVGDGTTTATVISEALFNEGVRHIIAGHNPGQIKSGIFKAADAVADAIRKQAKPIKGRDDIAKVATISANSDEELGNLIADALDVVGEDGIVTVEEGSGISTVIDTLEGMVFDKGFISPYFITDTATKIAEFEDARILVHEKKISNVRELLPVLEETARAGKPLLIIAEDVDGDALTALVLNRLRGTLRVCAVKAPAFGDRRKAILEDIAVLTGATVISETTGHTLENTTLDHLGTAKKVLVDKDSTTLIEGAGARKTVEARCNEIETRIEKTTSNYDREKLEERLARLRGKVAVITVGGRTETEIKERKFRVDDAVNASQKAVAEGIVPGGGVALIRAQSAVEKLIPTLTGDEEYGAQILHRAIEEPLRQIAQNAGRMGSTVVDEVRENKGSFGYNARTDTFEDLVKAGIIDPAAVPISAVLNASSVVGTLLTTRAMIATLGKEDVAGAVH
jgi:chaperonin GroEL